MLTENLKTNRYMRFKMMDHEFMFISTTERSQKDGADCKLNNLKKPMTCIAGLFFIMICAIGFVLI